MFAKGFCCGGKVLLEANVVPENLSNDLYRRYVVEPDVLILNVFKNQGGGSLHVCGEPKPWQNVLIDEGNLRCIYIESPEKNALEAHYAALKRKGIAIVGWGLGFDYKTVQETISAADEDGPISTGLTLICRAENWKQGIEIMEKHKNEKPD